MSVKRSRQARRVRRVRRERQAETLMKMLTRKQSERPKLGKAAREAKLDPRCPECGGATVGRRGEWRCVRSRKRFLERRFRLGQSAPERVKDSAVRYLRCGASGTVMQDGSLAVLVGGSQRKEEQDDAVFDS